MTALNATGGIGSVLSSKLKLAVVGMLIGREFKTICRLTVFFVAD